LEQEVPPCREVKEKLNDLTTQIAEGGPDPRKEVIEADGYQTIIDAWSFFCETGENRVRVFW
jgi:hypothetical protein